MTTPQLPAPGDLSAFAKLVAASFQDLTKRPDVFVADVDGDTLWAEYLAAFPEGSNPIFRKRSDHDCSTCRQFIRRAGAVVTIGSNGLRTVWDGAAEIAPGPYRVVAARMYELVRFAGIRDLFRVKQNETNFGTPKTRVMDPETKQVRTWEHLHTGEIPKSLRVPSPDQVRGDYRTTVQVFERGLVELNPEAVELVRSLIDANNLYRGEEHRQAVLAFREMQREYLARHDRQRHLFAWNHAASPAARFRNTVIGTLVQDLSEGQEVEHAVRSFETKVAPQNYKRTTAVITPGMVKKAMETVASLNLEPALERRFAVIGDVSVNDVKWVDGTDRQLMKGGLNDALMRHAAAQNPQGSEDEKYADTIDLDAFVRDVLPTASSLEIFFKNEQVGNLMSVTAPVHPEPARLFKWNNDFAWSYCGNVADSIRERVKKAGGKVEGAILRVSLSWFNYDDLDLHVQEPPGRGLGAMQPAIYYANKRGWTGGELDIDMNAGRGTTREPVENTVWMRAPPDGAYRVGVYNYCFRESSNPGFVVEVENNNKVSHFSYNKTVRNQEKVFVATLQVKGGLVEKITVDDPAITAANISQDKWGLKTETYVRVRSVMLSPNHWNGHKTGNKHTFFILDGAKNDEPTRGFYNEFLHSRLESHRKVFEVIADKTKCAPSEEQLSGLGFSSTKHEVFTARVQQGKRRRVFNVRVGSPQLESKENDHAHEHL